MRFTARALLDRGVAPERIWVSMERTMRCGVGLCGHCQLGPTLICRDGPVYRWDEIEPLLKVASCEPVARQRRQAQGLEREAADALGLEVLLLRRLPALAPRLRGRAARARPARSRSRTSSRRRARPRRARTTSRSSRARSRPRTTPSGSTRSAAALGFLVSIGACATSGRDPGAAELRATCASSSRPSTRPPSTSRPCAPRRAIADHVPVDFELQGCPIYEAPAARGRGRVPRRAPPERPDHPVCVECKLAGIPCVTVTHGVPCLGPVTQAGCGALCPLYARGCFGCFGPSEQANTAALAARWRELGADDPALLRAFRGITGNAPAFRRQATFHE